MSAHNNHHHHVDHNNTPYAIATPSAHSDSRREVGVPIAHGELRDPHYTTTQKTDIKFASADFAVNGNDVRTERRPPPYGDGSDDLPSHLQRHHGAPADAKADNDGVPFVVRSKGPPFGIGEE